MTSLFLNLLRTKGLLKGENKIRIRMLGLNGAGKTTILKKFKCEEIMTTDPLMGSNVEVIEYKALSWKTYSVGGTIENPDLWNDFLQNTRGIDVFALVFVVDASDRERMDKAKDELTSLLADDRLRDAILLVYANKQDLQNSLNAAEVTDKLGLHQIRSRSWYIQASSATTGLGLFDGIDWLANEIKKKKT